MTNKFRKKLINYFFPISFILILSFSRLIPHPWNFTPVLAMGIFSGFYFRNFFLSSFIVIFSMFIGDLYLGFHSTMFFTYFSMIIAVTLGFFVKDLRFIEILITGVTSSVCFFFVTNFGAWLTLDMYEKSLSGLLKSYFLAIPFFHNTLLSTLLYLTVLKFIFSFINRQKLA